MHGNNALWNNPYSIDMQMILNVKIKCCAIHVRRAVPYIDAVLLLVTFVLYNNSAIVPAGYRVRVDVM